MTFPKSLRPGISPPKLAQRFWAAAASLSRHFLTVAGPASLSVARSRPLVGLLVVIVRDARHCSVTVIHACLTTAK
jgi:hypothetical protein